MTNKTCPGCNSLNAAHTFKEDCTLFEKDENMDFGEALKFLKKGKRVSRRGWNGKGMYIYLAKNQKLETQVWEPCIVMKTAQAKHQPGWLASQADMLAEDWEVIA